MFTHLTEDYWITSKRESGHGRYDILLKAKDKHNFSAIIEIKPSVEKASDGMAQIEEKAYTTELESEGYTNILKVSLGVDGKKVEALLQNGWQRVFETTETVTAVDIHKIKLLDEDVWTL